MYETLHPGVHHEHVVVLKHLLQQHGLFDGNINDATYDEATEEAVREFQRRHHLHDDGVVGERTWDELAGGGVDQGEVHVGAGEVYIEQTDAQHAEITFGEGVTLTPGGTELTDQVDNTARDRLHAYHDQLVQVANEFWHHAHGDIQELPEVEATTGVASVFAAVGEWLEAAVPEIPKLVRKYGLEIMRQLVEAGTRGEHLSARNARQLAEEVAGDLYHAVANGAAAGLHQALAELTPHLQETFALHPELRDPVSRGEAEAIQHFCDHAGIHDPDQYSPYEHLRERLAEDFAVVLTRLRAQIEGHYGTNFERQVVDEVDSAQAATDARHEVQRELSRHPRQ